MNIISVYKCLCDRQRLRILNLLREGPLCVCHLMEILEMEQVKVSKQLLFMKERGLVEAERCAQWMIYRISEEANPLLQENLKCLQDCAGEELCFREDLKKRATMMKRLSSTDNPVANLVGPACCG